MKNIVPGELNLLARHAIVNHQQNHTRQTQLDAHAVDALGIGFLLGKIGPLVKAERVEVAVLAVHDLRVALEEQRQGSAGGADVYRLPKPVQYQNRLM